MGTPATKAKNKYNCKAYDRLNVNVPKGDRDVIQAAAAALGISLNQFVTRLIYRELGKKPPF